MKKNPYLINQYLKNYLSASIATMAIANINGLVDGVLMGRLLGPDALAAINLSLPVLNAINAIGMLLGGGASVVAARDLSKQHYREASIAFTSAIVGLTITGVMMALASFFFARPIAEMLCVAPSLLELSVSYISVLMLGSFFIILNSSFMSLIDVAGNPRMVTKCAMVCAVVNAAMDVFLVAGLGFGIEGAAMAMTIAAIAVTCMFAAYLKSDKSPYEIVWRNVDFISSIKRNSLQGIPTVISSTTVTVLIFTCNYYAQLAQGADGMFVMSVLIITMSLSLMLAGGSSAAFVAIGSMLLGRDDYEGLRMLFNRGWLLGMSSAIIFTVLSLLFPGDIAMLFGAESSNVIDLAVHNFPLMACFLFALCLNIYMATVYQVLGKLSLCMPVMASTPILACLLQFLAANFISLDYVWYSFTLAGILSLLITLLLSEAVRKKSKEKLKFFSLLPIEDKKHLILNASIPCTQDGVKEEIGKLWELCDKANLGALGNNVVLCLEELSLNIIEKSGRGKGSFIDVYIVIEEKEVRAYLQDNGRAFDPVGVEEDNMNVELKLVHNFCKNMNYNYSFGQNVTHMKWDR